MSAKLASASVWFFFEPTCTTYLVDAAAAGAAPGVTEAVCAAGFGFAGALGAVAPCCGAEALWSAAAAWAGAGVLAASCISVGAAAGAAPAGGVIEPSGRTTMVFTLRGPPSAAFGSSTEATVAGAEPSTDCVVGGAATSVEATGVGAAGAPAAAVGGGR